jgi:rRNA maturation endonuclease Nob1
MTELTQAEKEAIEIIATSRTRELSMPLGLAVVCFQCETVMDTPAHNCPSCNSPLANVARLLEQEVERFDGIVPWKISSVSVNLA